MDLQLTTNTLFVTRLIVDKTLNITSIKRCAKNVGFSLQAERFSMKVSQTKTRAMTISKEPLRCKLMISNTRIKHVMTFDYVR